MRRTISMSSFYIRVIYAVAGLRFFGHEIGELGLPESKHEGFDVDDLADLTHGKKTLSGISGAGMLHPLLDYNGHPGSGKSLADPVLDEALNETCSFFTLFGNMTKVGGSDLHLRGV